MKFLSLLLGVGLSTASLCWAGPPFRTDDPEPVEYQHWEVYIFSAGTQVAGDLAGVGPALEVNYGAAPDLQLHAVVPLAFDDPSGGPTNFGIGDTELGAKYRFIHEDEEGWRPQVGIFPMVELASGNPDRGLGAGKTRVYLPVWLQKTIGKWLTYGGGGYWINPGPGNQNYWFTGWLLQYQVTEHLALGGEVFHQTADKIGEQGSTGYNLGGVYDFDENHHLLFSAGSGLQNVNATNQFSYYLGFQWTLP